MSNLDPKSLEPGTLVAGYEIKSLIRHTQMGTVYQALQKSLNRLVALTVLSSDVSSQESFRETYMVSARGAAALTHLNAVQLFEAGSTPDGLYFLAAEFVAGRNLASVLDHNEKVPVDRVIEIMSAVASALEQAWKKNQLIHGDVNPSNIILRNDGEPKLAEIGLAKADFNSAASNRATFVSPLYASPEVILGQLSPNDPRADIYSFGCTLYHLLAGVPPFTGSETEFIYTKHLELEPQNITEFRAGVEPVIANLLHSMLQKKPDNRPSSWGEIIQAFTDFQEGPQVEVPLAVVEPVCAPKSDSKAKKSSKKSKMSLSGSSGRRGGSRKARVATPPKSGNFGLIVLFLVFAILVGAGVWALSRIKTLEVDTDWQQVTEYLQTDATLVDKKYRVQDHIARFGVSRAHPQALPTKKSIIVQIEEWKKKKIVREKVKSIAARKKNDARKKAEYEARKKARENR